MINPIIEKLAILLEDGDPFLGPERRPGAKSVVELESAMDSIFTERRLSPVRRDLIRAIILLWHDHLDESHSISQNIHNADGAYIHGMMHRRERDFSNAKYWFHQVGNHPVITFMKAKDAAWDPFTFIDECAAASPEDLLRLRDIQSLEFSLLLQHALADLP